MIPVPMRSAAADYGIKRHGFTPNNRPHLLTQRMSAAIAFAPLCSARVAAPHAKKSSAFGARVAPPAARVSHPTGSALLRFIF